MPWRLKRWTSPLPQRAASCRLDSRHESRLDESVGIKKDRHQSMPITHTSRNGKNYYDCISIGPAERIDKLAAKYLKYLGQDSMCELF